MKTARPTPIDVAREFGVEELFFSTTDPRGVIRHGNGVFKRVSGYPEDELLGAPHSIIRHPDMPRSVFFLLWEYIQAGKTIAAYVKNLAADGKYYWVLATAMPCRDGFVSIRLKPTSPLLETVQAVYRDALQVERRIEIDAARRKEAIAAGAECILGHLSKAGFADYDEFMREALATELAARRAALSQDSAAASVAARGLDCDLVRSTGRIQERLAFLYRSLDELKSLHRDLGEAADELRQISTSIHVASLNATISAQRLATLRQVLAVVAELLGEKSSETVDSIGRLAVAMQTLSASFGPLVFDVAVTELQGEVCSFFAAELARGGAGAGRSQEIDGSLEILFDELTKRCASAFAALAELQEQLAEIRSPIKVLLGLVGQMQMVQFTGKKEALSHPEGADFAIVFEDVAEQIEQSDNICRGLLERIDGSAKSIAAALAGQAEAEAELAAAVQMLAPPLVGA